MHGEVVGLMDRVLVLTIVNQILVAIVGLGLSVVLAEALVVLGVRQQNGLRRGSFLLLLGLDVACFAFALVD